MSVPAARKMSYTWDDYRRWEDDGRWEIIGGEPFAMSPAPLTRHQRIVSELFGQMHAYFKDKRCQALVAPVDVRLSSEDVVQPDVLIVCEPDRIKRTHVEGAPTLVIEVLSDSGLFHDRVRKFQLYARHGVREYWIVTPYPHLIEIFTWRDGAYVLAGGYTRADRPASPAFPDLALDLERVFDFPLEPGESVEMIKEGRPPPPRATAG